MWAVERCAWLFEAVLVLAVAYMTVVEVIGVGFRRLLSLIFER